MKKIKLPNMSSKELMELYKTVRPIRRIGDIPFYLRELTFDEVKYKAYTWFEEDYNQCEVDMDELTVLKDVQMIHKYSNHKSLFKSSVHEVICQIPKDLLNQVVAFEIIKRPETTDDFNIHLEEFQAGFHVSTVRLYSKKTA